MPACTGTQFLDGLHDDRAIWLDGERIKDVRTHPALRRGAATLAHLYDLQYDAALADIMTYASPTSGDAVGVSYMIPRTPNALCKRRYMMQVWAEYTCGMMGRTPDFVNINMMGFALWRDYFGEKEPAYGDNIWNYYEYIREHDLCLTPTLVSPQIDRSKPVSEWPDPYLMLGAVRETSVGVIVRGASAFDHPLPARFKEMDCMAIFNDVLVPWERIFIYGDVDKHNRLFASVPTFGHVAHQVGVKNIAKTSFLVGLVCRLAETLGRSGDLHIQELLEEMISYLETVKALVIAAEAQAAPGPMDSLMPDREPLSAMRTLYPRFYPRMIDILRTIGGSELAMTLGQADLQGPLAGRLAPYFQGVNTSAEEHVQLIRLTWDVVGDSFGSRQLLYERFFSGDPIRNMAGRYLTYDATACKALVQRVLDAA